MFDHSLWRDMRIKYKGEGTFPTIYEKVKPELDPLQFLAEERTWGEDSGTRPAPLTASSART
jgi:hypothetical protein